MDCPSHARNDRIEKVIIPEGVTRIPASCFDQCSRLREVFLPDSLEEICSLAFTGCQALERIFIPAGVRSIEPQAFSFCLNLREITVHKDNRNYLSRGGVLYDSSGTVLLRYPAGLAGEASFEDGLLEIGDWAFEWSRVRKIKIPEGVTRIGAHAFSGCARAEEVVIPPTVHRICALAFFGCRRLRELTIPGGVVIIERSAFYKCRALERIYMPDSVVSIESWVFDGCPKLTVICPEVSYARVYCEAAGIPHDIPGHITGTGK